MNAPIERMESLEDVAFQGISRRAFIVTAGGVGIAVAFGGTAGLRKALAQAASFTPNAWIRVAADGIVTLQSPGSEMGQGTMTAMPLLIAEDMDLDWSKVKVEHAPHMPKLYGNPLFGGNMIVGASRTMRGYYEVMRLAGMQAREVMIRNAARRWNVPATELTTEPHHVVHRASGRKMSYGEIATFAEVPADMPDHPRQAEARQPVPPDRQGPAADRRPGQGFRPRPVRDRYPAARDALRDGATRPR